VRSCHPDPPVRVCIVYDCLYPWTVGGAERWYRGLADELVAEGHDVTYLTRRQWPAGEPPQIPGVRVVAVSAGGPLYDAGGRRRISSPLRFGWGVLRHLLTHRRDYDAVHLCAFPYFSLLAARLALLGRPVAIGVDWFEVWSAAYWRGYLGPLGGRIGELVQRACVRLTPRAFVFSDLHGRRLRDEGLRGPLIRLSGLYAGPSGAAQATPPPAEPLVVFAGRHIAEKQAHLIPAAVAEARERVPGLRAHILGDGPERPRVLEAIRTAGAEDFVTAPGFVDPDTVTAELAQATCLILPSAREGYGLVVIEAAATGTPSIVLAGEANAAVELVEAGVNGFVADAPEGLADAIAAAHAGGSALRASTAAWFERNAGRLSAGEAAQRIALEYA
jgi:glycosyltransferase involved in cell wall biosynthesis